MFSRRSWAAALVALVLIVGRPTTTLAASEATGPAIGACPAQAPGAIDLLPDLRMAPLYGVSIENDVDRPQASALRHHLVERRRWARSRCVARTAFKTR